ncbi:hypothetical protein C8Q78DRAFT_297588 [Trametes maxima]|nr:hypothetical protein C8Q78DRAFT_297588 [Trametes maxima]
MAAAVWRPPTASHGQRPLTSSKLIPCFSCSAAPEHIRAPRSAHRVLLLVLKISESLPVIPTPEPLGQPSCLAGLAAHRHSLTSFRRRRTYAYMHPATQPHYSSLLIEHHHDHHDHHHPRVGAVQKYPTPLLPPPYMAGPGAGGVTVEVRGVHGRKVPRARPRIYMSDVGPPDGAPFRLSARRLAALSTRGVRSFVAALGDGRWGGTSRPRDSLFFLLLQPHAGAI